MKKLSKLDVFLFICMMACGVLTAVMCVAESLTGGEALWLRVPATILFCIIILPGTVDYMCGVTERIIEYFKERKKNKRK